MPTIDILENLFGAFFEVAFDKSLDAIERRRAFKLDLKDFLDDQQKHTRLEVFLFSRRKKFGEDENSEDYLTLDEIYIPLRLRQLRGTLPEFQKFRDQPEQHEGLHEQKIEDIDIRNLLDLMDDNEHFRRVMIIGTAGSGKSTFMKYLTQLLTTEKREVKVLYKGMDRKTTEKRHSISFKAIPILVRLRDLEGKLLENGKKDWEKHFFLVIVCSFLLHNLFL